jgi:hypothetical protein
LRLLCHPANVFPAWRAGPSPGRHVPN